MVKVWAQKPAAFCATNLFSGWFSAKKGKAGEAAAASLAGSRTKRPAGPFLALAGKKNTNGQEAEAEAVATVGAEGVATRGDKDTVSDLGADVALDE